MRLKSVEGTLIIHNGNNEILNSPKRLNTIENSTNLDSITTTPKIIQNNHQIPIKNIIPTKTTTTTATTTTNNVAVNEDKTKKIILNNINNIQDKVQWCNSSGHQQIINRDLTNNINVNNINNTLATSLGSTRQVKASLIYTTLTDDSFTNFEEQRQVVSSSSSVDISPQDDEDFSFDLSDSETSEESNLSNQETILIHHQHKGGIVNPNYPGFQHLAHTLDVDYTDEDEELEQTNKIEDNNYLNNNNNNNEDYDGDDGDNINDYSTYQIDSVNRLDSVENIQKIFYDKPINIEKCSSSISSCDIEQNIKDNIVGDFKNEIEKEFGKITINLNKFTKNLEEAVALELLNDTIENFDDIHLEQEPIKYNIKPNIVENDELNNISINNSDLIVLNDSKIVQTDDNNMMVSLINDKIHSPIMKNKISDAFLSGAQEVLTTGEHLFKNIEKEEPVGTMMMMIEEEKKKFNKEEITKNYKEKDEDSAVPRKKEKIVNVKKRRDQQYGSLLTFSRREFGNGRNRELNRRSVPMVRDKNKRIPSSDSLEGFDVYNIETAMPKIDLEVIESHLRAAREEERRRRTDREEIRRRLAMGSEDDYYSDRPGKKPSLQARLQSGMNLQICFMNENVSDTESPSSDSECPLTNPKQSKTNKSQSGGGGVDMLVSKPIITSISNSQPPIRPATLSLDQPLLQPITKPMSETDFFEKQARLQTEARMALAQAKEMARMQMEIERQKQKKSPITEMVRHSLEKVGIPFPEDKRRLSRQILTEMNVAQLQVIVNDLHTQIETLNENLVKFLMDRDDLHMEQDSMLVDIEDLTRYLGAKEQVFKEQISSQQNNNMLPLPPPSPAPSSPLSVLNSSVKPHFNRIANLVKK